MANSAKKRAASSVVSSRNQPSGRKVIANKHHPQTRSGMKQAAAIEMLRSPSGASIDALMKATGWQQHSVRGFLSGIVRKRLKLNLESSVEEGVRIYRISGRAGGKSGDGKAARHKS